MNPLSAVGGLVLIAIVGILISATAHQRYTKQKITNRQLKALKIRALQLQDILEGLARTECRADIRHALGECMIDTLRDIKDVDPDHPGIDIILEATRQLMSLPPKALVETSGPAESNHEIKDIQRIILASISQVRKLPSMGRITHADSQEWVLHLHMLYVQVEVDAHLQQGNKALSIGDKSGASNHFRVAQNKLTQSKYHGDAKFTQMRMIGEKIRAIYGG